MKTIGIVNIIYGSLQTIGSIMYILYSLIANLVLKLILKFVSDINITEIQSNLGIITICFVLFAASGINFIVSGVKVLSTKKNGVLGTKISAYINLGSYTVIAGIAMFGIYEYLPNEEPVEIIKNIMNGFLIFLGFVSLIYPAYLLYFFYVKE